MRGHRGGRGRPVAGAQRVVDVAVPLGDVVRLLGDGREVVLQGAVDVPERAEELVDDRVRERAVEQFVEQPVGLGRTRPADASACIRRMTSSRSGVPEFRPRSMTWSMRPRSRISRMSTRCARSLRPCRLEMRAWKVSSSTSAPSDMRPTYMPKPCRISTMPTAWRALRASRSELRLTSSSSTSSNSVGIGSPTARPRSRMSCLTRCCTSSVRLLRLLAVRPRVRLAVIACSRFASMGQGAGGSGLGETGHLT
ncbi:hypothetical protein BJF79_21920 [Actinomadura sp. CNU-125]|nr:hypothetical protein BJF79_21920 [Actinomadura sp. CNU-125]